MEKNKVIINSEAVKNPKLITETAKLFGAQCVVVSLDAKTNEKGKYEVYTEFGSKPTGLEPDKWARQVQRLGAGEIMINSIDKDGSLEGYDNELNRMVSLSVDIPVIVCGGAGKWQDFVDGIVKGKASAVCTTNIYHFTETSIKSAKDFMLKSGMEVRVS